MRSWYAIRARDDGAEVVIYDEIGAFGISARAFLAELGALPDGAALTLRLNSPGGSVFDAVAIHNALKRHAGGVTVWIDGVAASAASYVAMAGGEVIMPENAFLMIHDPAGMVMGPASDMRAMADALDKIKASLVAGYAAKSGRPEDEIAALMAKETWLDATEAVGLGLADRMAEPVRIAARFDVGRFRNAPPALVEAVEEAQAESEPEAGAPEAAGEDAASPEDIEDAEPAGDASPEESEDDPGPADSEPAAGPAPVDDRHAPERPVEPNSDPPADAAAIRAAALAEARAVVDLCALAGQPERAGTFLAAGTSMDEIRAVLLAGRAGAEPELDSRHPQPGRSVDARPWGEVIARTFRRKG